MKKPLREQTLEYLQYLKEQGVTHVPSSGRKFAKPDSLPPPQPSAFRPHPSPSPPPLVPIVKEIAACRACPLAATRQNTVPGQGALNPDIMFVGAGPGADEDEQGLAFVGRAGQLLTKMIAAMGYTREQVFIGNIVKCRPPNNRDPEPAERQACLPYLLEQIDLIQPQLILMLGRVAAQTLLESNLTLEKLRASVHSFQGVASYVTYHPAALLRNPHWKKPAWEDLQKFRDHYLSL